MTSCDAMRPHEDPCVRCPFSKATPPGQFPLERYELLRNTIGAPGREVPFGGPMFACHKTAEGKEQPCTGWLATFGEYHIGVRVAIAQYRLDPSVLTPKLGWPELFTDYDELIAVQARRDDDSETASGDQHEFATHRTSAPLAPDQGWKR